MVLFPGYLAVYEEGRDGRTADGVGRRGGLRLAAQIRQGAAAKVLKAAPTSSSPSRRRAIREASLVKKLEELGIGRPSTYASILAVLRDRGYARMDKNRFVAEVAGLLVTAFLERFFARYVNTISRPIWRKSWIWSRPASSTGKRLLHRILERIPGRTSAKSASCA